MSEMSGLAKLIPGCIVIGCIMVVHDMSFQEFEPGLQTVSNI
mgnify:CR=1 FL=1